MVTHFSRSLYQFIDIVRQIHKDLTFSSISPYPVVLNILGEKPVEILGLVCHTELAIGHLAPVCDLEELEKVAAIAMGGLIAGEPVITRCSRHVVYWIRADLVGTQTT